MIRINFGFLSMLCLVFITAKLFGAIAWSWWWVTAPLWAPFAIVFGACGLLLSLVGILMGVLWLIDQVSK